MKNLLTFVGMLGCILFSLSAFGQNINIPDANFKNALVNTLCVDTDGDGTWDTDVDINNDGEVSTNEALLVINLTVTYRYISSLEGIRYFTNLQTLDCSNNQLIFLNVEGLTNLQTLDCSNNLLTSLNVEGLTNLQELSCNYNQLTSLNVEGLMNLQTLYCYNNQLTSLNIGGLIHLQRIGCHFNQLSHLAVETSPNIQYLNCIYNSLNFLDVQKLKNLYYFSCDNNQLNSLIIKNSSNEPAYLSFNNNSNLTYICADESQLTSVQSLVNQYGYTNCAVNSYCSFIPGGTFYTLVGQNKWDSNNNGCEPTDPIYPNLEFAITNGTINGGTLSSTTGNYSIPLQAGNYIITPKIENPTYFTISPSSTTLSLPQDTLNLNQNFCIIPNGTHQDVEVTIIPTTPARPGFNATYQITYKNKGTEVASDSITFTYQDDRMDFVSASIAPDAQRTNVLQWNYTNLQPFETRTIKVVMNINSPMETPDVNVGDILSFQAAIYPFVPDEALYDNTHNFRQIVVGSYDPNDKTCLEGETIDPTQVGGYLHYLIRFENTGTYAAENIVVKDMIDVNKFDIATLQLTRTSHECFTRINGNKVEFIFENINLPFTEPDKHGYVAFKIKTKSTLVLGDAVTNQADIFFDYNLPITTNVASTQVVSYVATNNSAKNDFAITTQPNPTTNYLQFTTKVALQKAEVYDNLGRLVQTSGINNNQLSIGSLASGVYFVKVFAEEGVSVQKVVKE